MKPLINLGKWRSWLSTILGLLVALANAWVTIDWDNFDWSPNDQMKLLLSALIALGGLKTSINTKTRNESNPTG